jgi:uncharacterized protein with ATP-grasp and redox domains
MKTYLECIPCFLKQSLEAARFATNNEKVHMDVMKQIMKYLQGTSFYNSPPELSRDVHNIIRNLVKTSDPYEKIKQQSNDLGKILYPSLKKLVNESDDSLLKSIELAIIGNVIDFGTTNRIDVTKILNKNLSRKYVNGTYVRFKKLLDVSNKILYLSDNTGEIFFDKLLLEELAKRNKEITYVVKANPIINDTTMEDAVFAGIDKIANVIEGDLGQSISAPGFLLKYASEEFLNHFNSDNVVISKGQGNYESLWEANRKIFFLLVIKCHLLAKETDCEVKELVFKVNK